jgi:hypothetical protein
MQLSFEIWNNKIFDRYGSFKVKNNLYDVLPDINKYLLKE